MDVSDKELTPSREKKKRETFEEGAKKDDVKADSERHTIQGMLRAEAECRLMSL